jgi:EAL domain-containing protein (putative c-di-GMP-specific phosphodiesterase class I)
MLKAIESRCQALRIEIVAEGVETREEQSYLRQQTSIQFVQGSCLGKPQYIESLLRNGELIVD